MYVRIGHDGLAREKGSNMNIQCEMALIKYARVTFRENNDLGELVIRSCYVIGSLYMGLTV